MVGVPRSAGCRNCRRKKKGCDLRKPVCSRCAALGYDCGYDDKRWTFVSHRATAEPSGATDAVQIHDSTRELLLSPPHRAPLQRSLSRTAHQTALTGQFWAEYMPKDSTATVYIGNVRRLSWVTTVLDLADTSYTTRAAINAVALTITGRTNSDPICIRESTRLYAFVLRETNQALQNPDLAQSDGVLACCKVLGLYENLRVKDVSGISTQGFDWHNHVDGTCGLVELRGPAKHTTDHGHALFADMRLLTATSGITRRKPTRFTNHIWQTIPWETSPKTLYDEIIDVMLLLPDILALQDNLTLRLNALGKTSDRLKALTEGQSLLYRCIRLGDALNDWQQKVISASAAELPAFWDSNDITLEDICTNHGYRLFDAIMKYWVTCLLLYSTTWTIHKGVADATESSWSRLPDIPAWMNPSPVASCIAFNAYFFFDESAGYWGAASACFPLGAVAHYCAATKSLDSPCYKEVLRLFNTTRLGKLTQEFLRSIANTADSVKGDPANRAEYQKMATSWYRMEGD